MFDEEMKSLLLIVTVLFGLLPQPAKGDDWNLQIIPTSSDKRIGNSIALNTKDSCFHVVLTNTSKTPKNVWEERTSWGYFCLSFSIKLPDGKTYQIKKKPRGWDKNFPAPFYVLPQHSFVMPVSFNPDVWEGFPKNWKDQSVVISAKYEIQENEETKNWGGGVWTGSVSSEPIAIALYIKEKIEPSH